MSVFILFEVENVYSRKSIVLGSFLFPILKFHAAHAIVRFYRFFSRFFLQIEIDLFYKSVLIGLLKYEQFRHRLNEKKIAFHNRLTLY